MRSETWTVRWWRYRRPMSISTDSLLNGIWLRFRTTFSGLDASYLRISGGTTKRGNRVDRVLSISRVRSVRENALTRCAISNFQDAGSSLLNLLMFENQKIECLIPGESRLVLAVITSIDRTDPDRGREDVEGRGPDHAIDTVIRNGARGVDESQNGVRVEMEKHCNPIHFWSEMVKG